jgi:hypothetical protein
MKNGWGFVLMLFCCLAAHAQDAGKGKQGTAPEATAVPAKPAPSPSVDAPIPPAVLSGSPAAAASTPASAPALPSKEWLEVAVRLASIEKAVEKKDTSNIWNVLITAISGLLGVGVGGFINARIQSKALTNTKRIADDAAANARLLANAKAVQDHELAASRARLEIGGTLVARELEQLSELYGPLHALFGQSNALYRQMNQVLCDLDPERFQFKQGADFDEREFQILIDGQWERFRTVLHLGEVYGRRFGIEDYFDEIVAIGERIQKIVAEKAGFARPDDSDLLLVFGRYLAHYAILRRLHSELKARLGAGDSIEGSTTSVPMKVQESAVFPHEIQDLVKNGFEAISKDLMEWRRRAA